MEETYALELRDISKRFGSVQANDHVNLTLRKSEGQDMGPKQVYPFHPTL